MLRLELMGEPGIRPDRERADAIHVIPAEFALGGGSTDSQSSRENGQYRCSTSISSEDL
jgi:hypothetical protein